ncbi:hypothetical protein ILUMI_23056 [Ignelater luminosus]|uniref:Chitin-binding type-2 domain-containing protein n=1 Tax=Ignelater luminosus TaxID=2038154 RepID=A0A8K0C8V1_IGNLU|nr:hypothetical protein ILUMI_23056 [Ignelater luminosus]
MARLLNLVILLLAVDLAISARKQQNHKETEEETSDQCPEPYGYFADAEQCDKYYECSDGQITEKLCPDGMVFNDFSSEYEKCDLPFNIDCTQRPKLQTPQPSDHCPRKNGYFGHEETNICDQFYYCVDGKFNMITCPSGLVYNENTGICTWPDEAKKKGCSSKEVFQFDCPKVNESIAITHPRYPDPEDCQYFYVCINGDTPRRNGCKLGQAFDDRSKKCDWARKIPECADWYKDQLTDEQLDALENPPKPKSRPAAPINRRKPSRKQARPVEEVEDK